MARKRKKQSSNKVKVLFPTIKKRHINKLFMMYIMCSHLVLQGVVLHEKVHLGVLQSRLVENEVRCSLKVT